MCVQGCGSGKIGLDGIQCVEECPDTTTVSGTKCVCDSGSGKTIVNLEKQGCVDVCPAGQEVKTVNSRQECACKAGLLLSSEKSACLSVCEDSYRHLYKPECVKSCGANERTDGAKCSCANEFYLAADGQSCVKCGPIEYLSLNGTQCVTSVCSGCAADDTQNPVRLKCATEGDKVALSGGSCISDCPGEEVFFQAAYGPQCSQKCPSEQFQALGEQRCSQMCGENQVKDVAAGKCVCKEGFFPDSTGKACTDSCPDGKIVSLLGGKCIEESKCAGSGLSVSVSVPKKCVCSPTGYLPLWNESQCVQSCAAPVYLSLNKSVCVQADKCGTNTVKTGNDCACNPEKLPSGLNQFYLDAKAQNCVSAGSCGTNLFINLKLTQCTDNCGENAESVNKVFCQCKQGFIVAASKTGCVSSCTGTEYLNYTKDSCTFNCGSNSEIISNACKCKAGNYVLLDKTGCSATCPEKSALNLKKTECILAEKKDACGGNTVWSTDGSFTQGAIPAAAGSVCRCKENYLLNPEVTGCQETCGTGQSLSLAGNQCLKECRQGETSSNGKCVCAPGFYLQLGGAKCVANCTPNVLNFARTKCVAPSECVNGAENIDNICQCASSKYINPAADGCIDESACVAIQAEEKRCYTQCKSGYALPLVGKICVQNCGDGAQSAPTAQGNKCSCLSGYIVDQTGQKCVFECDFARNLLGTACVTTCPGGSTKQQGPPKQCVCNSGYINEAGNGCTASCGIVSVSGKQCVTACGVNQQPSGNKCICKPGFYLSSDKLSCMEYCGVGEVISLLKTACLTACPENSKPFQLKCACNADYFISTDGNSCANTCPAGQAVNLLRTQCTASCGSGTQISTTNGASFCTCQPNYFLNPTSTGCLSNCPAGYSINLKKDGCVASCGPSGNAFSTGSPAYCKCRNPAYIINSQYTDCIASCPVGEFVRFDKKVCVSSCGVDSLTNDYKGGKLCICPSDKFVSYLQDGCVSDCGGNHVGINGRFCLNSQTCPAGSAAQDYGTPAIKVCRCLPATPYRSYDNSECVAACVNNPEGYEFRISPSLLQCTLEVPTDGQKNGTHIFCPVVQIAGTTEWVKTVLSEDGASCFQKCPSGQNMDLGLAQCVKTCPSGSSVSGGVCKCATGTLVNSTKDGCAQTCGTAELFSVQGTSCVLKCGVGMAATGGKCKCNANTYLDIDGAQCVSPCPQAPYASFVGVSGVSCVLKCPAGSALSANKCTCGAETPYASADGLSCAKSCALESSAGGTCVPQCSPGETIGLSGRKCASGCPPNSSPVNGRCTCAAGFSPDGQFASCVARCAQPGQAYSGGSCANLPCPAGSVLNLAGTHCEASCGPGALGVNGECRCPEGSYPDQAYSRCVSGVPAGQLVSLAGNLVPLAAGCGGGAELANGVCVCSDPLHLVQTDRKGCGAGCTAAGGGDFPRAADKKCYLVCPPGEAVGLGGFCGQCGSLANVEVKVVRGAVGEVQYGFSQCFCRGGFWASGGQRCAAECPWAVEFHLGVSVVLNDTSQYEQRTCVTACPVGWHADLNRSVCAQGDGVESCGASDGTNVTMAEIDGGKVCICEGSAVKTDRRGCVFNCTEWNSSEILSRNGVFCLGKCPANEAVNLEKLQCTEGCGEKTQKVPREAGGLACACLYSYFLAADASGCVEKCVSPEVLDLLGERCLQKCPADQAASLERPLGRQCQNLMETGVVEGGKAQKNCGYNTVTVDWEKDGQLCACIAGFAYDSVAQTCDPAFKEGNKTVKICTSRLYKINGTPQAPEFVCIEGWEGYRITSYQTYGMTEAVDACNTTYNYVDEAKKTCSQQCDYFYRKPGDQQFFYCLERCSGDYPYVVRGKMNECVSECPGSQPFLQDGVCSNSCPQKWYSSYKNGEKTVFTCLTSCGSVYYLNEKLSNNRLCMARCEDPYPQRVGNRCLGQCADADKPFRQKDLKCGRTCLSEYYVSEYGGEQKRCVEREDCPKYAKNEKTTDVPEAEGVAPKQLRECMRACNETLSFIDGFQCKETCPLYYVNADPAFKTCVTSCGYTPNKYLKINNTCVETCPKGYIPRDYVCVAGSDLTVPLTMGVIGGVLGAACLGVLLFIVVKACKNYQPKNSRSNVTLGQAASKTKQSYRKML